MLERKTGAELGARMESTSEGCTLERGTRRTRRDSSVSSGGAGMEGVPGPVGDRR